MTSLKFRNDSNLLKNQQFGFIKRFKNEMFCLVSKIPLKGLVIFNFVEKMGDAGSKTEE